MRWPFSSVHLHLEQIEAQIAERFGKVETLLKLSARRELRLMGINEEVRAAVDAAKVKLAAIQAGQEAAIVEIQKLDELLRHGNVAGAREALADLASAVEAVAGKAVELQSAVDEPDEEAPPAEEPPVA